MAGFADSLAGRSVIFRFDIRTDDLLNKYVFVPTAETAHLIGDMVIHSDGYVC
jgi:hypothetical protein